MVVNLNTFTYARHVFVMRVGTFIRATVVFSLFFLFACSKPTPSWEWDLPPDFNPPIVPADNPMSKQKVDLGRYLFYEKALSGNGEQSCATCHQQQYAFAENRGLSIGSTGEVHHRNALSLTNAAYNKSLTWAQPELKLLERQILIPLFGDQPVEMQLNQQKTLAYLKQSQLYRELFQAAFPNDPDPIHLDNGVKALASFVRSLISFNSPFDRYAWYGEDAALNEAEIRGMTLFMSERTECRHCHGGFNFSLSSTHLNSVEGPEDFHNTGLYNPRNEVKLDLGLFEFSLQEKDKGRFRPPTLRNIALTAPYMHDGSIATLEEVLEFYAAGGREISEGLYAGDGRSHPNKSLFLHGFVLSEEEKQDMLAFLHALTDRQFIQNPAFSAPGKVK